MQTEIIEPKFTIGLVYYHPKFGRCMVLDIGFSRGGVIVYEVGYAIDDFAYTAWCPESELNKEPYA